MRKGSWYTKRMTTAALTCLLCAAGCQKELPAKVKAAAPAEGQGPAPAALTTRPATGKKLLLVHSYHAEYPWVDAITQGVKATLDGTGVTLDVLYMDTKRKSDEQSKAQAGESARRLMEAWRPDVVIAVDDNAQQYFATQYVDAAIPIVFTGVDADPSKYGYPAANVTGIIERPQFRETIELARTLRPIKRIAVLSNNDETSVASYGFMKEEALNVEVVEWRLASDFDEWQQAILGYNHTVDAVVLRSYQNIKRRAGGERVDPSEVARWTIQHATIPTMAFQDHEIRDGVLAGVVKAGFEYGQKPTQYALAILSGTPVARLPIVRVGGGVRMINGATAKQLGITLSPEALKETRVVGG